MMIKHTLLLTGLLMATSVAFSQRLAVGIRGGLNIANMSLELPSNLWPAGNVKKSRTSFNAGAFGQYSLNDKMALQAELFYSGEGVSFTDPGTEMAKNIKLSYLGLPIFFKYGIAKGFYAMAGPQFSYLLKARSIYANGDSYDVKSEHKTIVMGLVPAIGYDWKNFSINLRYNLGLSKLPKSAPYWNHAPYVNDKVKSNVFAVVVAYKIFN